MSAIGAQWSHSGRAKNGERAKRWKERNGGEKSFFPLPLPPPPSFHLPRPECEKLIRAARIPFTSHGNACYAGYIVCRVLCLPVDNINIILHLNLFFVYSSCETHQAPFVQCEALNSYCCVEQSTSYCHWDYRYIEVKVLRCLPEP